MTRFQLVLADIERLERETGEALRALGSIASVVQHGAWIEGTLRGRAFRWRELQAETLAAYVALVALPVPTYPEQKDPR